jgi:hypothetical protein
MSGKNENHYYVERRDDGKYAGIRGGAARAGFTGPTQANVIQQIQQKNPEAPIHVERQRNTSKGQPDWWRKP